MGLFSLLEAIVGRPLRELLADIPMSEDVVDGLLGQGPVAAVIALAVALEKGDWQALPGLCRAIKIKEDELAGAYIDAVQWPHEVLSGM